MNGELLSEKVAVRVSPSTWAGLEKIEARHGYAPTQIARLLLEGAVNFFDEHGYFHFPVVIEPAPLAALAAEAPGTYGPEGKNAPAVISPAVVAIQEELGRAAKEKRRGKARDRGAP